MSLIKLATVWLGGCSGCHMSFLDLDEWLLELAQQVELVYSPFADVKTYPKGVDVALVEGAIANQDHLMMIKQVRDHTRFLIAFGDCAVTGNVTALRNPLSRSPLSQKPSSQNPYPQKPSASTAHSSSANVADSAQSILNRAYLETATHPQLPESDLVPPLLPQVIPVHKAVAVDLYLPGCPPDAARIRAALSPLLAGNSSAKAPQLSGADHIRFG